MGSINCYAGSGLNAPKPAGTVADLAYHQAKPC